MKIFAVDDEPLALKMLCNAIAEAVPDGELKSFLLPSALLEAIKTEECDVAFLDIQMRGMSGLELARSLTELKPRLNIIFVTGYAEYTLEAYEMFASGYVLKPVDAAQIVEQIKHLRYAVDDKKNLIAVQTFGNFEIFVNGSPVLFKRKKSKELLAYLVDRRGASVDRKEIASVLFEEGNFSRAQQNNLSNIVRDLQEELDRLGVGNILEKNKGCLNVCADKLSCDLYDFYKGIPEAVASYNGEYMAQYSWGEYFNAIHQKY